MSTDIYQSFIEKMRKKNELIKLTHERKIGILNAKISRLEEEILRLRSKIKEGQRPSKLKDSTEPTHDPSS